MGLFKLPNYQLNPLRFNLQGNFRDQLGKVSTLINEFERKQEAAQVHRKKEILLNRNILIGVGILVVAVLVIYILR